MTVLVLLPIALALLAEAAWTALLAGLLQEFALQDPTVGLPAMLLAATAGWVAARRLGPRLGDRWPAVAAMATVGVAAVGWLSDPEVRAVLVAGGPGSLVDALFANAGGLVVGVAFLRGIAHARLPPDPRPITTVLAVGTPGIALAAVIGGMVADPWRAEFLADAAFEVVVFLVAGIGALTLSRLTLVGSRDGAGVDWRRNPAWLLLVVALLAAIAVTGVVTSRVAGPAIVTVLGAMIPSLLLLGLVAGIDRRSIRVVLLTVATVVIVGQLARLMGASPRQIVGTAAPTLPPTGDGSVATPIELIVVALVTLAVVVVAIVLVRLWMRRTPSADDDLAEERWIDHGGSSMTVERRRRRARWFGRSAPADAVAAYRMLLTELAGRRRVRRGEGETPAEHASRLRDEGWGALGLDLLAADYGLVRFGGRTLTRAEDRRAIGRAALLRKRLTGPAEEPRAVAGGDGGEQGQPGEHDGDLELEARSKLRIS